MTWNTAIRLSAVSVLLLVLSFGRMQVAASEASYTVTDIGSLVGTADGQYDSLTAVTPAKVNEEGDIVANAAAGDDTFWSIAFTNIDGKARKLGQEKSFSFAYDLNEAGEIVGFVTTLDDSGYEHLQAVVWRERHLVKLPALDGDYSLANAINEDGDIAGTSSSAPGTDSPKHAVIWHGDAPTDLGTLGGKDSRAFDLNDEGLIVGMSLVSDRAGGRPVVWEDGSIEELEVPDGLRGGAEAINNSGTIAGNAFDESFNFFAVRWTDKKLEMLPPLIDGGTSLAVDINSAGIVVGWARSDSGADVGVFWDADTVVDLNTLIPVDSGWLVLRAQAINDSGQILAISTGDDGFQHGLLLDPVDASAKTGLVAIAVVSRTAIRSRG